MSPLLHCSICKELFRTQSILKNHIKRVHQSTVKVKFVNDEVREITKVEDDGFKCICGKVFQHPRSILRHAKQCSGTTVDNNIELSDSISISMDSIMDNIMPKPEDPGDCTGTHKIKTCLQ